MLLQNYYISFKKLTIGSLALQELQFCKKIIKFNLKRTVQSLLGPYRIMILQKNYQI